MLTGSKLIAFVPTRKPEEARGFFEEKLGLEFIQDDRFAIVFRSGDATLRVVRAPAFEPAKFTIAGWEVSDISAAVRELSGRGVQFQRYSGLEQDESGVWTAPGGAKVAWFLDPDGNVLSISQH